MNNLNNVILEGNLTSDPESRQAGGSTIAKYSIAVNRDYKGEQQVSFFEIESWGKQADNVIKYLKKGSSVTVQGELRQDRWKTDDGKFMSKIKVVTEKVRFNPGKRDGGAQSNNSDDINIGDDIPF